MKTIFKLSIFLLFLSSCIQGQCDNCAAPSDVNVKVYKQKNQIVDTDSSNDWIYWYLIMNNNGGYYYYHSYSPVTDYSNISWTESSSIPYEIDSNNPDAVDLQEISNETVNMDELSHDMQSDISSDYDSGNGDYGNGDNGSGDSGDGDSGDGDSGEGDSGGDSGGGDSGGGDGGE